MHKTKTIVIQHNIDTVEPVIMHDLDKAYLTDKSGEIKVYRDAKTIVDDKHLFVLAKSDNVVDNCKKLREGKLI